MEYKEFAKYYDKFYSKKNYKKEVEFLKNFIDKNDRIIDIGCGTGIHASLLNNYDIDGLDLNEEMLEIAKTRINGSLYHQNMLNIKIDKKYNIIISMFAVINHLRNVDELELCLKNSKIEKSKIIFEMDNKVYNDEHIFRIFSIDEIKNICTKVGLKVKKVYENYDILKKGKNSSKNLQFIIELLNLTDL